MKSIMEEASSIAKAIETAWNRAGQPTEFTVKVLELPQTSFFGLKTSKSAKVAFFFNEATVTVRPKESSTDRQPRQGQQRPVTLRQPGNKSEHDQQRRPHQGQRQALRDASGDAPQDERKGSFSSDRQDNRQPREPREQREPREMREPREQRDSRDNRGYEQRQDHRTRPQGPRRPDDRNRRPDDRRPRHSDYAKSTTDRDGERSEHSSYSQEPRENWTPEMAQVAQEWIKETLVLMGKPDITVNTHVSHNYLKVNLSAPVLDDARQEETQLKSWGMLAMEAVREKMGKPLRSLRIVLESPRS
jgi:hypothetical protein